MTKYTDRLEHVINNDESFDWLNRVGFATDDIIAVIDKLKGNSDNFAGFTGEAIALLRPEFINRVSSNDLVIDDLLDQSIHSLSEPGSHKIFDSSHLLQVYDALDEVFDSSLIDEVKDSFAVTVTAVKDLPKESYGFQGLHFPEYPHVYESIGIDLSGVVSELDPEQQEFLSKAQDVFDRVIIESLDQTRDMELEEDLSFDDLSDLGYASVEPLI